MYFKKHSVIPCIYLNEIIKREEIMEADIEKYLVAGPLSLSLSVSLCLSLSFSLSVLTVIRGFGGEGVVRGSYPLAVKLLRIRNSRKLRVLG